MTFYLMRKNIYSEVSTERGRRLNLPWEFNYSFVFLIIKNCIHNGRRHVAVLRRKVLQM